MIKPGQTLFRVDNKPVLLMDGTTPAYRDLSSSDSPGPDILELNANLVDLGYNPDGIVVDDTWQAATTAAVKELQHDLGEGQSGKILLGKIVFLPGKQLVSSVLGTVGSTVSLTRSVAARRVRQPRHDTDRRDATTDTTDPRPRPLNRTTPADDHNRHDDHDHDDHDRGETTTTPGDDHDRRRRRPRPQPADGHDPDDDDPAANADRHDDHAKDARAHDPGATRRRPHDHHHPSAVHDQHTEQQPVWQDPVSKHVIPGPITLDERSSGSDNLSAQTLKALLQLVRQQQQALAHQNGPGNSSNNGTPSSNSKSPSQQLEVAVELNSKSPIELLEVAVQLLEVAVQLLEVADQLHRNRPTNSSRQPSASAGGGGAGTAIMDTTSTHLVVTVDLSPSSQSEAVVGGHVTVEMPDGSTVPGTISAVSSVAQSSSSGGATGNTGSGGGSASVPVTVTLDKHVSGKGLDQAAVSVNFVQARANHVLSVPVTALLATSGSTYAVQEASPPHTLIPVRTGMFAAGYVEISGSGIHPGLRVTDSQG